VADQWFLEGQGDGYTGQFKVWLNWPEGFWDMRGDVFRQSDAPEWA
jgi:hypothetical protein